MPVIRVVDAAKMAGISRAKLYRMVDEGEISKTEGGIELSELLRVFKDLKMPPETDGKPDTVEPDGAKPALDGETTGPIAAVLQERVRGLEAVIEELRTQLQTKDNELRARLQDKDELIEELRGEVRLLALPLLTAPDSALKPERRGILQRLFGRG